MTTKTEKRIAWSVLAGLLALMAVLSNAHAADTKVSALPAAANIQGTEDVPVVQTGATVRSTPSGFGDYLNNRNQTWVGNNTFNATLLIGTAAGGTVTGVTSAVTANGAPLIYRAPAGGATSGNGGAVSVLSGGATDGDGGTITFTAANGVGTNRAGGSIVGNAGTQTGSGAVGNVLFGAGTSVLAVKGGSASIAGGFASGTGVGGDATVSGGVGNATGAGGQGIVTGGAGNGTLGNAGDAVVRGGLPVDGNGGNVQIIGRNGVGTNRNGGNVTLTTGAASGSGTAGTFTVNGKLMAGSGTFNMTSSAGLVTPPSVSATYSVNGGMAMVCTNTVGGTSNATNFVLSGIPVPARPSVAVAATVSFGTDNSISGPVTAVVSTSGTVTLGFNGGAWTATGSKASGNSCYAYTL